MWFTEPADHSVINSHSQRNQKMASLQVDHPQSTHRNFRAAFSINAGGFFVFVGVGSISFPFFTNVTVVLVLQRA